MNNEQNNMFTNLKPISPNNENHQQSNSSQPFNNDNTEVITSTPINLTPITPINIQQQDLNTENISNAQTTDGGIIPIIPIPEVKDATNTNQVNSNPSINQQEKTITPTIIMPESKDNSQANLQPQTILQSTTPELKLESSSPFDIGVNAPLNTNTSINIEGTNSQASLPITPINVSNNTNNNGQVVQDINIPTQEVHSSNDNIVSVGSYILHMILFAIPVVGFIMLIIKALDKNNKNISNFAKAQLLMAIIATVLMLLIFIVFGTIFTSTFTNETNTNNYQTTNFDY